MAPLRFRAWHKKKETMLTVEIIDFVGSKDQKPWIACAEDIPSYDDPGEPCYGCELDEVIVMQSSGLNDVKGDEVFEADVVRWISGMLYEVKFHKGCFCFELHPGEWHLFDPGDVELMGNIYENPDLLPPSA